MTSCLYGETRYFDTNRVKSAADFQLKALGFDGAKNLTLSRRRCESIFWNLTN